jgi:NAD+ diphosphatase
MKPIKFCPECGNTLAPRDVPGDRRRLACSASDCRFIHYGNPVPVVAAIVERDGAVILVRNHGWPEKFFGLVTGFLEAGETAEEGVLREVKEELGLDGEIAGWVGAYAYFDQNQIILAYHVRSSGEVTLGDELVAYKAILPEKLRPWPMGTGKAVSDWLAARAGRGAGS